MIVHQFIKSPLNYTGGKYRLLPQIMQYFPNDIDVFADIFCGGGDVGINVQAQHIILNDIDKHVVGVLGLFKHMTAENIITAVNKEVSHYGLSDSSSNGYSAYDCNSSVGLASYNRVGFLRLRDDFNSLTVCDDEYYVKLFTLIVFSFNNQIRFNSQGAFNLPVGKRDFNSQIRHKIISFAERFKEKDVILASYDFRRFSLDNLGSRDFIYVDPPYLVACATYNERNAWNDESERELLNYLDNADRRGIRFALSNILRNGIKRNAVLLRWIERNPCYSVHELDFNYSNASYHKKNRSKSSVEILITNYK